MKTRVIAVLVAVAAIVISGVPATGDPPPPQCNWYNNSAMTWWEGYGYVCSYTGSGCGECWNQSGDWCVAESIPCQPRHHPLPP
jgi:hypothetical protein